MRRTKHALTSTLAFTAAIHLTGCAPFEATKSTLDSSANRTSFQQNSLSTDFIPPVVVDAPPPTPPTTPDTVAGGAPVADLPSTDLPSTNPVPASTAPVVTKSLVAQGNLNLILKHAPIGADISDQEEIDLSLPEFKNARYIEYEVKWKAGNCWTFDNSTDDAKIFTANFKFVDSSGASLWQSGDGKDRAGFDSDLNMNAGLPLGPLFSAPATLSEDTMATGAKGSLQIPAGAKKLIGFGTGRNGLCGDSYAMAAYVKYRLYDNP